MYSGVQRTLSKNCNILNTRQTRVETQASEKKLSRQKLSARIDLLQLNHVARIVDLTDLHCMREEKYHALDTNTCIIPFLRMVIIAFILYIRK